ncbi:MAG: purine-nucleoside phosphorylase [Verrucomicrobiales bacterium]|nr:purine-nucleoside phosphorylase [Verrucomicrobiales bacterium]
MSLNAKNRSASRRKSAPASPDPAAAVRFIRRHTRLQPVLAMVLGSSFREVEAVCDVDAEIPFNRVPGLPATGVEGHAGRLLVGRVGPTPVLMLSGRCHFYEGHTLADVTFPVRVAAALGVETLLLTNAAGGINPRFRPGDFMILRDHINLMGVNPLCGCGGPLPRFVDLSEAYDPELQRRLRTAARQAGARGHAGVYLAVSGPSYETPAEIRAFARLGADAVGMSTVPETIVARQCGLRVAGLSCITNLAAGRGNTAISHEEVLEAGRRAARQAGELIRHFAATFPSG